MASPQQQQSAEGSIHSNIIETALTTLQPIRDLAKNWDIDIAGCLDEYLEDLELTQETRQQVKAATLNFAQAALVLQNSSGIYSRKVDYLHSHVYKVQEELSLNELLGGAKAGNKKGGRGGNKTGIDAQVEEFLNFDPHLEFLLLDDVLPTDTTDECHKINLAQESSTGSALAGTAATDQSVLTTGTRLSMGSALNRRLSLGSSVGTGTTSGMAMMDQTGFTTNNGNGKPNLAAAQRAFLGTAQDTGSLRLTGGSCDIGEEGVLFLPGSQEQTTYSSQEEPISTHAASGSNPMDFNNDGDDDFGGGGGAFDDGMDDNDDDGGAAFVMADNDQNDDAAVQQKKRVTFADSTAAAAPKIHKPVPVVDPWALLDRDTPDSKKARPLRVGKTIVLPDSVDALPSECVTGSRTRRVARKQQRERVLRRAKTAPSSLAAQTFQQVMTTTTNTLLGQKRALEDTTHSSATATTAAVPLKDLAYGNEFAYIAKATAKRKAEERRALRKQQQQDAAAVAVELDDDDGEGFGLGGGNGDYDDDDNDFGGGGDVFGDDDGNNGPLLNSNTGIASVDDVYQNNWNDDNGGETPDHRTFEELCRAHIRAFARGAEKYAAETKLTKRVQNWQEKLIPLLEIEEQRPVFDIHAYGNAVIESMEQHIDIQQRRSSPEDALKAGPRIVDFRDVTSDSPSYEVCRMFLATLSLHNSGNLRFVQQQKQQAADLNSFQMELLCSDIERPMETYLAPSVEHQAAASLLMD